MNEDIEYLYDISSEIDYSFDIALEILSWTSFDFGDSEEISFSNL